MQEKISLARSCLLGKYTEKFHFEMRSLFLGYSNKLGVFFFLSQQRPEFSVPRHVLNMSVAVR